LWTAIQAALTGAKTPQEALTEAQQQAASALK
jgi:ABC-type glycerol-3-phosphate transport system substrate-binding protein